MTILVVDGVGLNAGPTVAQWDQVDTSDVEIKNLRPSFARYEKTTLISGHFSPAIAWVEDLATAFVVGIQRPVAAPGAAISGPGGLTGTIIVYFTWAHLRLTGGRIVEGNPSPGSGEVEADDNSIDVTIPATAPDDRTTHGRIYLSIDGALPRRAADVPVGTTVVTISMSNATLLEQESLPTKIDSEGFPLADFDGRGVPPADCKFVYVHKHRSFWTGSAEFPGRIWWSLMFEIETVNNAPPPAPGQLAPGYIDTLDGEKVTGIGSHGDSILLFYATGCYEISNYGGDSFLMRKRTSRFGCISHFTIQKVADEITAWLSQEGIAIYNGQFYSVMTPTHRAQFRDEYTANRAAFEDSIAIEDKVTNVYKVLLYFAGRSYYYVGHYLGSMATIGGAILGWEITRDIRARRDRTLAVIFAPGSLQEEVMTGSCDGFIRKENIDDNGDDDGDAYQKKLTLQPKHLIPKGQDGDDQHASTFQNIDLFMRLNNNVALIEAYAGDDLAIAARQPQYTKTIGAGNPTVGGRTATEKTSHFSVTPMVSGKGLTWRFSVIAPVRTEFRGFGVSYTPQGPQSRRVR